MYVPIAARRRAPGEAAVVADQRQPRDRQRDHEVDALPEVREAARAVAPPDLAHVVGVEQVERQPGRRPRSRSRRRTSAGTARTTTIGPPIAISVPIDAEEDEPEVVAGEAQVLVAQRLRRLRHDDDLQRRPADELQDVERRTPGTSRACPAARAARPSSARRCRCPAMPASDSSTVPSSVPMTIASSASCVPRPGTSRLPATITSRLTARSPQSTAKSNGAQRAAAPAARAGCPSLPGCGRRCLSTQGRAIRLASLAEQQNSRQRELTALRYVIIAPSAGITQIRSGGRWRFLPPSQPGANRAPAICLRGQTTRAAVARQTSCQTRHIPNVHRAPSAGFVDVLLTPS